ncbi:MAG TPA: 16S rRNA (uracil(1498)-N(3))-methyltransferase, partial [Firmicutes bacterium]|nr:16S rRNA (uracil(1498)-N(3))-methyltransferase [Bacillota bacterium]
NVMRAKRGEKIEVVDEGDLYLCEISSLSPLEISVLNEINRPTELNVHLILGFALLKGGHDELVLMKGTELGVSSFLPFISERTIIRLDQKERKKRQERFQKIVSNASSQSKRLATPEVMPILDYKNIFD